MNDLQEELFWEQTFNGFPKNKFCYPTKNNTCSAVGKVLYEKIPTWIKEDPKIRQYIEEKRGFLVGYFEHSATEIKIAMEENRVPPHKKGFLYFDWEKMHRVIYGKTKDVGSISFLVESSIICNYSAIPMREDEIPHKINFDKYIQDWWLFVSLPEEK